MNNHFHMTLPSGSSASYYPNTVARFVTKLPERIRLEGEYKKALAEIIYPNSWHNIENRCVKYWIVISNNKVRKFASVITQSGCYEDGFAFAELLQRQCSQSFDDVKCSYSGTIGRFSLSVHSKAGDIFQVFDVLSAIWDSNYNLS
jgi:hypothetical protein